MEKKRGIKERKREREKSEEIERVVLQGTNYKGHFFSS